MVDELHPKATHHLPFFITAPGETDVLMVGAGVFLFVGVVAFCIIYFRLQALPEQIARQGQKAQLELVSILCLISLLSRMHIFWIAGLLLAFVDLPDLMTPLRRVARSVVRIAGLSRRTTRAGSPPAHDMTREAPGRAPREGDATVEPKTLALSGGTQRERSHI